MVVNCDLKFGKRFCSFCGVILKSMEKWSHQGKMGLNYFTETNLTSDRHLPSKVPFAAKRDIFSKEI
jgi:hypothetical protein